VPGGEPASVGVPYGSRARLILLYVQSEAPRTDTREVQFGRSLHAWPRRLGTPIGGKSMRDVRDQAERLSHRRMSVTIRQDGAARPGWRPAPRRDTATAIPSPAGHGCTTCPLDRAPRRGRWGGARHGRRKRIDARRRRASRPQWTQHTLPRAQSVRRPHDIGSIPPSAMFLATAAVGRLQTGSSIPKHPKCEEGSQRHGSQRR
jgi:hypothetical protein